MLRRTKRGGRMKIETFTQEQMQEIEQQEQGFPVRRRWFKHKETGAYQYQISLMEINNYEEVQ